jgi:hypothetical protein
MSAGRFYLSSPGGLNARIIRKIDGAEIKFPTAGLLFSHHWTGIDEFVGFPAAYGFSPASWDLADPKHEATGVGYGHRHFVGISA